MAKEYLNKKNKEELVEMILVLRKEIARLKKKETTRRYRRKNIEKFRERARRYRKNNPLIMKNHEIRYLQRKIEKEIQQDPLILEKPIKRRLIGMLSKFDRYTRLTFNDILPKECAVCGSKENLHIHHIRYKYPLDKEDLIRLCKKHHVEEHQKLEKEDTAPLPVEN